MGIGFCKFAFAVANLVFLPCHAIDGDTIVLDGEHIRITAIDAPEMPGHCRPGRDCAPGDPFAAKVNMGRLLASGTMTISRLGTDHYGRTVADVFIDGRSVSCAQLKGGFARYWARYDGGGRVARECAQSPRALITPIAEGR